MLQKELRLFFILSCFASLCFGQNASSALAVVPITKEPSHHLVFENEYVRVFKVEVAPHAETLYHKHDVDYVFVTLGDSDVDSVRVGEPPVRLQLKDGETRFTKGGFAHKAVNNSDKPFVNVTVELKKDRVAASAACEMKNEKGCVEESAVGAANSWRISRAGPTRIFNVRTAPGKSFGLDAWSKGKGLLIVWKGELAVKTKLDINHVKAGDVRWIPSFQSSALKCSKASHCDYVVLEFPRNSARAAQPRAAVPHESK